MKKTILLLLLLGFVTVACKKEEDPTRSELISRVWKVASVISNGSTDTQTDYSAYRLTFKSDGSYTFTNALTSITPTTGTWELADNEQSLLLNKGTSAEQKAIIQQITSNNFDVSFTYKNYKNGEIVLVFKLIPVQ
jgi:hypothetical protein